MVIFSRHGAKLMSSVARILRILPIPVVALALGVLHADMITFEDLPDVYFYNGGGQNIGSFYSGIVFGPNVTGLSVTRFGGYDDSGFPPHSGDVVIWDASDPTITIS